MFARVVAAAGLGLVLAMLVTALWGWQNAGALARAWEAHGPVATWGARSASLALAAVAQALLLTVVAGWIYRRDVVSEALRLAGLLVAMLAGVSALALGLAGR